MQNKGENAMFDIFFITKELQNTSKTTDKMGILKREKNNENWKKYLKYTHDPEYVYGIQLGKMKKYLGKGLCNNPFNELFEVFEYLLENNTGDDDTVKKVVGFIDNQPEELKQFFIESITKKLRMGFNVSSIQKAYPGLVDKFEVQRAKSYVDHKKKVSGNPFSLSEKKNGIRCITIKKDGVITNLTRQNKVIKGLNEINKEIAQLKDGVYDGELVTKDEPNLRLRNILQETKKIVNSDMENKIVNYWIFDYLTIEEFEGEGSKDNYFERRDNNPVNNTNFDSVRVIPELYRGKDTEIIATLLDDLVDVQGREGLMYYQDKPYVKKRTDNILKVKKKYSSDLKVIGFEEGKGKYKGMLGALLLDYKGFPLGCSGMSDELRVEIWNDQNKYLGVIVEVEHEQESQNEGGGLSLEYPAFIQWRFDKDEINYAHE